MVKKCLYCEYKTDNGKRLGGHMTNCKSNPNYKKRCKKLSDIGKGKVISEEVRKKISKSRKKYLIDNPDKVPYLLNHSREESYPEKYFTNIFNKNGLILQKGYKIWLYELDFCIIDKKIDIEIDGDQHYLDKKIVESDKRRNEYLIKRGWDIIRIKWSDYQKLDKDLKVKYINDLISYINGLIKIKPEFKVFNKEYYCKCGVIIHKKSKMCISCHSIKNRKVERPEYELLIKEVKENGYSKVGRRYGVSDNAIRKWIKFYKEKYKM